MSHLHPHLSQLNPVARKFGKMQASHAALKGLRALKHVPSCLFFSDPISCPSCCKALCIGAVMLHALCKSFAATFFNFAQCHLFLFYHTYLFAQHVQCHCPCRFGFLLDNCTSYLRFTKGKPSQ